MSLAGKKCLPCEGGVPPLSAAEVVRLQKELTLQWEVVDNKKIRHEFLWPDFKESMIFANKIATLAEAEGHHPDLHILYNRVIVELTTHAARGLTENDFILARKIELLN